MPTQSTVLSATNLTDLKTNVDAFFAANLTARILNISFIAREKESTPGLDLSVSVLYDPDGITLTAPYIANFVQGLGAGDFGSKLTTFMATVTTQFSQGPYTEFQSSRNFQNSYTGLIVTNTSMPEGNSNWLATGSSESSMQLGVGDSTAFSVGPAAGTILGAAAPAGGFQLIVNTLLHDATLDEGSYWILPLVPSYYGLERISLNLHWASTTAVVGDAVWGAAIAPIGEGSIITSETHSAFQRVTSTTAAQVNDTVAASIPFTNAQAGGMRTGDYLQVLIARFGSDAADTLVGDASLIGAELSFGQ